jgi:hypothetical protein
MVDWLFVGIHRGYHSIKWSQEKDPTKDRLYHANNPNRSIYAICKEDITFKDAQGRHCHDKLDAHSVILYETFRFQKNKEHGQIKSFAQNVETPDLCAKTAMQRIIHHAGQLGVNTNELLAIYKNWKGSNKPKWIVKSSIDCL